LLYIIVALKPEAQAFVDKYKLQKSKLKNFTLYSNESMRVIISGLGVTNATNATQTLINHYDITDDDIYLNIGICGADIKYPIASLLEIGTINYDGITYSFKEGKEAIVCVDEAVKEQIYPLVDMESYGFYDAVIHNPAIKKYHIFKVVSDNFEPHKVTKEYTKSLVFNAIDAINIIINY